jgi:glycerophosphoryl diester phosphodiesterase
MENTLDSFDSAEAEGADGFELDVRLTSDGEAVVHHDPELLRGDRRVAVSSLTLLELREIPLKRGEFSGSVPILREVFLRYGGGVRYLVELKPGPSPRPGLLEFRVAALLAQFHLAGKALVLSFAAEPLRRIREIEPSLVTCLLFDGTAYRPEGQLWPDLPKGCAAIAPNLALVSDRLVADARAAGLEVHVWTVNEPADAVRLAALGVTSVITDVPADVVAALRPPAVPAAADAAGPAPEAGE